MKIVSTVDVSKPNDVFNFSKSDLPENCVLSGVSWLATSNSINESRLIVLRLVFSLFIKMISGYRLWLFIGNSTWQSDNRIVRHRRLWGALKARGAEILHAGESFEYAIESDLGLKYFGAKLLSELSVESVIKTLNEERCGCIVALPCDSGINEILKKGWSSDNPFDKGLLEYAADKGGLVLKAVGEFDDVEAGFVAIGRSDLVSSLV